MSEKPKLIVPLTKSPHSGRSESLNEQDWYKGLQKALEIFEPGDKILIISDVQIAGEKHEADIYFDTLINLGADASNIETIRAGEETVGQIHVADREATQRDIKLVFIVTATHYSRVKWIVWFDNIDAVVIKVGGLPRKSERLTDFILTFLFPIIDILSLRSTFLKKVIEKRSEGKFRLFK